jgi:hypothetical protein
MKVVGAATLPEVVAIESEKSQGGRKKEISGGCMRRFSRGQVESTISGPSSLSLVGFSYEIDLCVFLTQAVFGWSDSCLRGIR